MQNTSWSRFRGNSLRRSIRKLFQKQLPFRVHSLLTRRLQDFTALSSSLPFKSCLLCWEITAAMFGMQLQLTMMLLRLHIFLSLCPWGKCLSNNFKKLRPMFVVTCSLNGGLNQSILHLRGFFLLSMALKLMAPEKPLLARAFDYMGAALLNSSWLQAMLNVRCSTIPVAAA